MLQHSVALSGCLLVLLEWDEARRALVRRLRALRLPLWVMVLVPAGRPAAFESGPPEDQPEHLLVLEAGQVGPGLQRLGVQG